MASWDVGGVYYAAGPVEDEQGQNALKVVEEKLFNFISSFRHDNHFIYR